MKKTNKLPLLLLLFLPLSMLACRASMMSRASTPAPAPIIIQDNSGDVVALVIVLAIILVAIVAIVGVGALIKAGRDTAMENLANRMLDQRQQDYEEDVPDYIVGKSRQTSLPPRQQQALPPRRQQELPPPRREYQQETPPTHKAWMNLEPQNPNKPIWQDGEIVKDLSSQLNEHPAEIIILLKQNQIQLWDPGTQQPIALLPAPGGKPGTALQRYNR